MVRTKMCGIFRDEDIEYINEIKPEFIGFVFFKKSHRNVDKDTAFRLKQKLDKNIKAVGVFVDEEISFIKELVEEKIIDMVQLHGHEDSIYVRNLRDALNEANVRLIKAIVVRSREDINKIDSEMDIDYYLLDSGMGGGSSFDWNLVKELDKPIFLAGGLNTENVQEAIEKVSPYAVDVSSGIETDKVKDYEKMKQFISIVRNDY